MDIHTYINALIKRHLQAKLLKSHKMIQIEHYFLTMPFKLHSKPTYGNFSTKLTILFLDLSYLDFLLLTNI